MIWPFNIIKNAQPQLVEPPELPTMIYPQKRKWGMEKAASVLTKRNGQKLKMNVGNVRELLADWIRHDAELVKKGERAELTWALVQEIIKKTHTKKALGEMSSIDKVSNILQP